MTPGNVTAPSPVVEKPFTSNECSFPRQELSVGGRLTQNANVIANRQITLLLSVGYEELAYATFQTLPLGLELLLS